ncbi:MAG TPA: histidine kinase [Solirubrobacteraceae bacterium]|nr:histidine kinase [Solirubrobacteraceae bacterium]
MPGTLLARVRALPPYRLDALIGAAVYLEVCAEIVFMTELAGAELLLALTIAGSFGLGVALRRRAPLAAVPLATGGLVAGDLIGPELTDHVVLVFFVVIFVTYSAGAALAGTRLAVAFVVGSTITVGSVFSDTIENDLPSFVFTTMFTVAAPMLFGHLLRNRARLNQALREKARRAEQERVAEAEAAAVEERTRIAGELHDVVAHALSAMTVQAGAARRLAEREPARAASAFAAVEHTGREALTELRRLLGVLRKEDEELALAPQPSLAHVHGLAQRATAAGLPVALTVSGAARSLPAGVDLTAYRVVQEALGRARDGGSAGRADVTVTYGAADVAVEIRDDGGAEGRGLLGMHERVTVYGGELSTAAVDGGGWRVAARLPVEPPA